MQLAEKQELVRLLSLYQTDLLMDNDTNIREAAKHPEKKWEDGKWNRRTDNG